jgi:hypothetical protein
MDRGVGKDQGTSGGREETSEKEEAQGTLVTIWEKVCIIF